MKCSALQNNNICPCQFTIPCKKPP